MCEYYLIIIDINQGLVSSEFDYHTHMLIVKA